MNKCMRQYAEVLRLSDKLCIDHEFAPEFGLSKNLNLHRWRCLAYRRMGIYDKAAYVEKCLRATLQKCLESYGNDDGIPPNLLRSMGCAYNELDEYHTALEAYQLAIGAFAKSKEFISRDILHIQYRIALTYKNLGRYHEAKELLEMVLAKEQSVLSPSDREIRWTKEALNNLEEDWDELNEEKDRDEVDEEEDGSELDEEEGGCELNEEDRDGLNEEEEEEEEEDRDELDNDELDDTNRCTIAT